MSVPRAQLEKLQLLKVFKVVLIVLLEPIKVPTYLNFVCCVLVARIKMLPVR
jgi:hypothetical protein